MYAQWSGGEAPKHDVQIARALLTQRLAVKNQNGLSMEHEVTPEYLAALKQTDHILASAPDGILPEDWHSRIKALSTQPLNQIVNQTRLMIVQYQQSIDITALNDARNRSNRTSLDLTFLLTSILLGAVFFLWVGVSIRKQQIISRKAWQEEAEVMQKFEGDLKEAELIVESLKELNLAKNDFIATINHELRTPLTSIVGYIDLLKEYALQDPTGEMENIIKVIERNSDSLLSIVESILSLSKLDSKETSLDVEEIFLPEIIEKNIFILSPLTKAQSITIDFSAESGVEFALKGSASQISQVVLNLLSNAVKFSPENSHVEVFLRATRNANGENLISLEIRDHGIGIPAEDIPKLFSRFYRAGNAVSSQIPGTGLGLSIVSRVLELHGATVSIESAINEGTTFIVEFPRHITDVDRLVSSQRQNVLKKAIVALTTASPSDLIAVSHKMSGALGFYALDAEMYLIDTFQKWLEANPEAKILDVQIKREALVVVLQKALVGLSDSQEA